VLNCRCHCKCHWDRTQLLLHTVFWRRCVKCSSCDASRVM